jgi:hypothetical protein
MHHERAVGELDALAHRREADAAHLEVLAGPRGVEPDPVVGDLDAELPAHRIDPDGHGVGLGVLGGVRERLLHHAVGERSRPWRPPVRSAR